MSATSGTGIGKKIAASATILLVAAALTARAASAATVWSDDFESGFGKWPTRTNSFSSASGNPNNCIGFFLLFGASGQAVSQSIAVNGNTQYKLLVDYNQAGAGGYVKIEEYNNGGQLKATQWLFSDNAGTQSALQYWSGNGWTTYTQAFTTGATAATIVITLWCKGTGILSVPYFDNVNLTTGAVTTTVVQWREVVR